MFYWSSYFSLFFSDENLVYRPVVVDPCFNTVETYEFAALIEEVSLGSGSGRFVG